jgi:hypothetical protein
VTIIRRSRKIILTYGLAVWFGAGILANALAYGAEPPPAKEAEYDYSASAFGSSSGGEANADRTVLERLFFLAPETLSLKAGAPGMRARREKGWLGITMKAPQTPQDANGKPAIEVIVVFDGSAAQTAGVRSGDRIIGLDGAPLAASSPGVADLERFRLAVNGKSPGDSVHLQIERGGDVVETVAVLRSKPKTPALLKPHPELDRIGSAPSLLAKALQKENLAGEFALLAEEMRRTTEDVISPLVHKDGYNPLRLREVNYVLANPLRFPAVARGMTGALFSAFNGQRQRLDEILTAGLSALDVETDTALSPPQTAGIADWIERVLQSIERATQERTAALAGLSAEELDWLEDGARGLLIAETKDGKEADAEEKKRHEEELKKFFTALLKVDLGRLLRAGAAVGKTLDVQTLQGLSRRFTALDGLRPGWVMREEPNLTVIETPLGKVFVGGPGPNVYTEEAVLILDFGGDDRYLNAAGASRPGLPFSVVVDFSGNDVYLAGEDFAQGAGLLGGGFLIDLEGDDIYIGKNHAQGAGVFGVGVLADLAGNDEYRAVSVAQGAGFSGVGILAEGGGDDHYAGRRFVQGFGFVKGYGAIIEAGGNDQYSAGGGVPDFRDPGKSFQSLSQGFGYGLRPYTTAVGASGGIGILADAEGNDTYIADYFAQGASYWYALGILDDRKGHDRYISGRYSQGAGIHYSAGILLDGEGDDNYLADFGVAQGCGHDFGLGWLVDDGGNDRYIAGVMAQGAGNDNGIGILNDNGGDDEYRVRNLGQGRGNYDKSRELGSFGLLFDIGGNDRYDSGAKNDHLTFRTQWGILADTH